VGAAGLLLLTPRLRPRAGPALRTAPLPVTATVLSAVLHGMLVAILVLAATVWSKSQPKTYVVNLVPAVAAVGTPQGRASAPPRAPTPPRVEEPPPRPSELPERPTPRAPAPPPDLPARAPELPTRAPDLPARAPALPARTAALPDRPSLPRPSTAPRAGEKELPPVASAPAPRAPAPVAPAPSAAARAEAPPPPPAALGRPSGSAQGSGAVTLNATDFPFAWYLAAVQRKITERWEGRALQGRQPVVTFEISREGHVANVAVKTSSGNQYYDLIATRAIAEAAPFPKLPDEFPGSVLRIHLGFNFAQDRG
jgi:TonB family protein